MSKFVDIVVIGRNEGNLLRETLKSVLIAAVRFRDAGNPEPKVIYVDSQSTDNSVDIAVSMNIDVKVNEGYTTAAKGRSIGTVSGQGDYIMYLDGDTLLHPDWLIVAVPYLEENEFVAGVGGRLDWLTIKKGCVVDTIENYRNIRTNGERVYDSVGGTFLYKRAALEQVGGWNTSLKRNEEFELHLRLAHNGYTLRRLVTQMGVHRDDKTGGTGGFLLRYLLTPRIFDAGRLTWNAPFSPKAFYILFRRYWLHAIHPILITTVITFIIVTDSPRSWFLAFFAAFLLILCHFFFKGFHVKRTAISLITMNFFSLGWYVGLFLEMITFLRRCLHELQQK